MAESYEVVVIGSGFGGGITACRLAEAGHSVCVLERGRRFAGEDFIDDPDDAPKLLWHESVNPGGLFDVRLLRDVSVICAAGVGGGSLVYANVQLRAPAEGVEAGWSGWGAGGGCRGRRGGGPPPARGRSRGTTCPRRRSSRSPRPTNPICRSCA